MADSANDHALDSVTPYGHDLKWFEARFIPEPMSGCWLWIGSARKGYGTFLFARGQRRSAHRALYELLVGPVPEGLDLDHLCRVRCCVNPRHLEPVTRRENLLRGVGRNSRLYDTHCQRGHSFDEVNTYRYQGRRRCRACVLSGRHRREAA